MGPESERTGAETYQTPEVCEHLIRSTGIRDVYRIRVAQPISRTDKTERFPVLYVGDSDDLFGGYACMSRLMQSLGDVPRYILVGIGYENSRASGLLRMRDFHKHDVRKIFSAELEQLAGSPLVGGMCDLASVTSSTDARDFLQFIREELIPFIADHYPVVPNDNNYCGYSAGGSFGLYTLFTQSDVFRRYIIGSPSTSFEGRHFGIELVREFLNSKRDIQAQVFMSVGELEDLKIGMDRFDLVTGYYALIKFLNRSGIAGLTLTTRVFPGETHATAWTSAFTHGVRALFGEASDLSFLPNYMSDTKRPVEQSCRA
jgi:uncharacterized protein